MYELKDPGSERDFEGLARGTHQIVISTGGGWSWKRMVSIEGDRKVKKISTMMIDRHH